MSRQRFTDWLIRFRREDSAAGALVRSIREAMRADATFPRDPQAEGEIRARAGQIGPAIDALPEAWALWRRETGRDKPVAAPSGIPAVPLGGVGLPAVALGIRRAGDFEPAAPYEIRSGSYDR
jgi:hypothetical protein